MAYLLFAIIEIVLAAGSVIAFDYVAAHVVAGAGPLMFRLAAASARRSGGTWWIFGISTETPAQEHLVTFLGQNGLQLAEYEAIGDPTKGKRMQGGLAVAIAE